MSRWQLEMSACSMVSSEGGEGGGGGYEVGEEYTPRLLCLGGS